MELCVELKYKYSMGINITHYDDHDYILISSSAIYHEQPFHETVFLAFNKFSINGTEKIIAERTL